MKIAIATAGRFHVLDLARELSLLGHDVNFYSFVPKRRAIGFGLPPECHIALLPYVFPLLLLERLLGKSAGPTISKWLRLCLDWIVSLKLRECDVFIGMSGMYVNAPALAKRKFGARIYIERGSRHILSQLEILKKIPGCALPSTFDVERELANYGMAEKVVIPSTHVLESFLEYGFPERKLFINPYGVDTRLFTPAARNPNHGAAATAIFVGGWSLRKGAELVVSAVEKVNGLQLLHVGALLDCPFPSDKLAFTHFDPVDQRQLPGFYARADFFVLPSREEGLSLVLAQALGCGLPVVCTRRTGGPDLAKYIDYPEAIVVVDSGDIEALAEGMRLALELSKRLSGRDLLGARGRQSLTWAAYGMRYHDELLKGTNE
ncbi:MAG: glycosyltransferase family 4 protein [Betaproteobacteria bacterium]|nr:glycosyltransferase family 4 protein [Betaproteobacteria bacterium]